MQRSPTLSPKEQAASLRRAAEQASGSDRAYYLWLAAEWDKAAVRDQDRANSASTRPAVRSARRRPVTIG